MELVSFPLSGDLGNPVEVLVGQILKGSLKPEFRLVWLISRIETTGKG